MNSNINLIKENISILLKGINSEIEQNITKTINVFVVNDKLNNKLYCSSLAKIVVIKLLADEIKRQKNASIEHASIKETDKNEKYFIIYTLRYIKEMSYNEISEILNIPLGTVKIHLFRARKIFKNL